MEIFDETLDRRIWSLADTRLQWHKRIAETRRTIPKEIEAALSTLLGRHAELDDMSLPHSFESNEQPIPDTEGENPESENITSVNYYSDVFHQRIEETLQNTFALAHELSQVSFTFIPFTRLQIDLS